MHNTVRIAYNIFADNAAIAARYPKGRACQRLAGLCINLFDEQAGFLGVLDGERVGFALFQRNCARILIQNIAARSGNLGYDVIRRVKALNECGTVLAGRDVLTNNIAVGTGQLEHSTRQRLLRFCIDLGDRQTRLLSILDGDRSCLIGGMLDLVRLIVQNVLFQGRNFLHLVSACRSLFDGDFTILISGIVTE